MLLLALDTATEVTSVALARVDEDRVDLLGEDVVDAPRAALSRVLPMAEALLASAGLSARDIDGVVVGRGCSCAVPPLAMDGGAKRLSGPTPSDGRRPDVDGLGTPRGRTR